MTKEKTVLTVVIVVFLCGIGLLAYFVAGVGHDGDSLPEATKAGVDPIEEMAEEAGPVHKNETDNDNSANQKVALKGSVDTDNSIYADDRVSIVGRIISEIGDPIIGAEVRLEVTGAGYMGIISFDNIDLGIEGVTTCTTDQFGRFLLKKNDQDDENRICVFHPDYVPDSFVVKKTDSDTIDVGDLQVVIGGVVSGYVSDHRGNPIEGANLIAQPENWRRNGEAFAYTEYRPDDPTWKTMSAQNGYFTIPNLPQGSVRVCANHPDHILTVKAGVSITKGQESGGLMLVLSDAMIISGRIINKDRLPLPDALIKAELQNKKNELFSVLGVENTDETKSDKQGLFQIKCGSEDSIKLKVSCSYFFSETVENVYPGTTDLEIILKAGLWIAGVVSDSKTGALVREFKIKTSQRGMASSSFLVLRGGEAKRKKPDLIKEDRGAFLIEGLKKGNFNLVLKAEGYAEQEVNGNLPIDENKVMHVQLIPEAVITGVLLSPIGKPVPYGRITLKSNIVPKNVDDLMSRAIGQLMLGVIKESVKDIPGAGDVEASGSTKTLQKNRNSTTDMDGKFKFNRLQGGRYHIVASHPEYSNSETLIRQVRSGEHVENLEIILGVGGTIEGTVFDTQGIPMNDVKVEAELKSGGKMQKTQRSDQNGFYRIPGLNPGDYKVRIVKKDELRIIGSDGKLKVNSDNGSEKENLITVVDGRTVHLDLHEPRLASISGQVIADGIPAPDISLQIMKKGFMSMPFLRIETDRSGNYGFDSLDAGSYKIQVILKGHDVPVVKNISLNEGDQLNQDISVPTGVISGRICDTETGQGLVGVDVTADLIGREAQGGFSSVSSISISSVGEGKVHKRVKMNNKGTEAARTDNNGYYRIMYLEAGVYKIRADKKGYKESISSSVEVIKGAETEKADINIVRNVK